MKPWKGWQHSFASYQRRKTIVFSWIASKVVAKGNRALVLVRRRELVRQTVEKLASFGVAGVIVAGWPANPERRSAGEHGGLGTPDGLAPPAELLVVDEAHHCVAR